MQAQWQEEGGLGGKWLCINLIYGFSLNDPTLTYEEWVDPFSSFKYSQIASHGHRPIPVRELFSRDRVTGATPG